MKILILGSSGSNIDLMEYCFNAGMEVHCISLKSNKFISLYSHTFVKQDYSNQDFVETYCIMNNIDIIYSMGSDICMQISSIISKKLNLPSFITPETANLCVDKFKRREALGRGNSYNIKYKLINEDKDLNDWDTFPCIIKPVDNQGQKGILRANSKIELKTHYSKSINFSQSKQVIVEEFISGRESTINCYIVDRKIHFFILYDKIPSKIRNSWMPLGYKLPSFYKNTYSVVDLINEIIKVAKIENGPLMIQIKYRNNQPKVIEYFSRPGGSHTYEFIEKYCGVNLNETLIKHFKGESLPALQMNINYSKLTYNLLYGRSGEKIKYIKNNPIDIKVYVNYYLENEMISGYSNYERIGYYIQ